MGGGGRGDREEWWEGEEGIIGRSGGRGRKGDREEWWEGEEG